MTDTQKQALAVLAEILELAPEFRVGQLMAVSGKQVYEIPGSPDLSLFPFVHIWCEQFSVDFGHAELK